MGTPPSDFKTLQVDIKVDGGEGALVPGGAVSAAGPRSRWRREKEERSG